MGVSHTRPKSARPPHSSRGVTYPIRPQSAQMLPSVVIQGTAINKPGQGSITTHIPSQPMPVPSASSPRRDTPIEINGPSMSDVNVQAEVKPGVKMEDKSVNVPSVAGEPGVQEHVAGGEWEAGNRQEEGDTRVERTDIPTMGIAESHTGTADSLAERPSTGKGKKVRFATEVVEGAKQEEGAEGKGKEDDMVRFFLTEEKDPKDKNMEGAPEQLPPSKVPCHKGEELVEGDTRGKSCEGEELINEVDDKTLEGHEQREDEVHSAFESRGAENGGVGEESALTDGEVMDA